MKIQYPEGGRYTPSPREEAFIQSRVAKMSPKEILLMNAAQQLTGAETAADFINLTFDLNGFILHYPANNDTELGAFVAKYDDHTPQSAMPYIDKAMLGQEYRATKPPGVFMGGAYVTPPRYDLEPTYFGDASVLQDEGYSVLLRLASPSNKEGVWLRLPDFSEPNDGKPDELRLALDELGVSSLSECRAVEAECCLPQVTDLLSQYDSLERLFYDGCNLGYALDEQGQGRQDFMEHFSAAMEYEGCTRLDFALDITQNLNCYDYIPASKTLAEYGQQQAVAQGLVRHDTLSENFFNYAFFGEQQLEKSGMQKTAQGYIGRNDQQFHYEASQPPPQQVISM